MKTKHRAHERRESMKYELAEHKYGKEMKDGLHPHHPRKIHDRAGHWFTFNKIKESGLVK